MDADPHNQAPMKPLTRWLIRLLWVSAALTLVVEWFVHRHSVFAFEETFAFYALFGFVSYVFIVRGAMLLRRLIKRGEDYYD